MFQPDRSVDVAVLRRVVGDEVRTAVGWSVFYALIVYASAAGYVSAYPSAAERTNLQATLGHNVGLAALFGKPYTLATVGGFTAWRSEGILLIVGGVWGAFLGARIFRGVEEAGRWEYVLAGAIDRGRAAFISVLAALCVLAIVWSGTLAGALASNRLRSAGFGTSGAILLATELIAPAVLFTALSAMSGQIFATRMRAAGAAGVVFGALFCARLASGVYPGQRWLPVVNPLQWFDSVGALASPEPAWLLAGYGLAAGSALAVAEIAAGRDLGAALVPDRPPRRAAPVRGVTALGLRLTRASGIGWIAIATVLAGMVGILAGPVADAMAGSNAVQQILARLAGRSTGARAFLRLTMLTIATILCLCAASLVASLADEEISGRLERLLALPVRRIGWLAGRVGAAGAILAASGLLVGLTAWATSSWTGSAGIRVGELVRAGLNIVPVAVLVLSVGVAAYAVRAHFAAATAYRVIAVSFAMELIGSLVRAPGWLLDLSVFHHVALAPAVGPRWRTDAAMLGLAAALCIAAAVRLRRRDLAED